MHNREPVSRVISWLNSRIDNISSSIRARLKADLVVAEVDDDGMKYHKKRFLNLYHDPLAFLPACYPDEYTREVALLKMAEVFESQANKLCVNYE